MAIRTQTYNNAKIWDENRRYKVNEVVKKDNIFYQNTTGKNSDPFNQTDWVQVGKIEPKVYTALLTQSGTDAPVATVLENTLGDIVFNSLDGINNTIQSDNLFTENKTYVFIGSANDIMFTPQKMIESTSTISFTVSTSTDAMLNTPIEIRVYN